MIEGSVKLRFVVKLYYNLFVKFSILIILLDILVTGNLINFRKNNALGLEGPAATKVGGVQQTQQQEQ